MLQIEIKPILILHFFTTLQKHNLYDSKPFLIIQNVKKYKHKLQNNLT